MKKLLILMFAIILNACGSAKEVQQIIGKWVIDAEKYWNKNSKNMNKNKQSFFDQLTIDNKKKRIANFKNSLTEVSINFNNDHNYALTYQKDALMQGKWEVIRKGEKPILITQNQNKEKEIFEIEKISENNLILKRNKNKEVLYFKK